MIIKNVKIGIKNPNKDPYNWDCVLISKVKVDDFENLLEASYNTLVESKSSFIKNISSVSDLAVIDINCTFAEPQHIEEIVELDIICENKYFTKGDLVNLDFSLCECVSFPEKCDGFWRIKLKPCENNTASFAGYNEEITREQDRFYTKLFNK